jgi:hypothetical protein
LGAPEESAGCEGLPDCTTRDGRVVARRGSAAAGHAVDCGGFARGADTVICGRDEDVPPGLGTAGASVAGKGAVTGGAALAGGSGSCAQTLSTAAAINAKMSAL